MKILVTGGAGFIGSHLVEELLSNENEILIFDNCLTGKKENLEISGNFTFINDDFGSENSLEEIEKFDPDICFHLAAQSSVVVSVENPALDFEHNILQPIKLIQVLLKSNCKKLVFTSSGGTIFGEPSVIPTAEGDYADEPESPYGVAKKRLNELIKIMTKNSYLNDEEPIIFGDGEQTRDYVYVKDVVSALIKASTIDENHFLNIGTGVETSVNDLANSMKTQFNSDINPIYKPAREGELNRSVLNNTKAKKELDWKPEFNLDDGMKQVFNWLKA